MNIDNALSNASYVSGDRFPHMQEERFNWSNGPNSLLNDDIMDTTSALAADSSLSSNTATAASLQPSWHKFCDNCAKFAAYDFAQSWYNHLADNLGQSNNDLYKVDEKLVALKFCESFVGYFQSEARRICRSSRLLNETSAFLTGLADSRQDSEPVLNDSTNHSAPVILHRCHTAHPQHRIVGPALLAASSDTESDSIGRDAAVAVTSSTVDADAVLDASSEHDVASRRKNFLRYWSLKNVKRTFFKKHPPETSTSEENHNPSATMAAQNRSADRRTVGPRTYGKKSNRKALTTSKTVVEVVKDGIVNFISGKELDGKRWDKGRLCLIKTAGGYLLEFYSPPKAAKPRSGVFSFLISEVRETTDLETPDVSNAFVIKADNLLEFVVQAKDAEDMQSWISLIRQSVEAMPFDSPDSSSERVTFRPRLPSAPASESARIRNSDSLPSRRTTTVCLPIHQRSSAYFGQWRVVNEELNQSVHRANRSDDFSNPAGIPAPSLTPVHRSLSQGNNAILSTRRNNVQLGGSNSLLTDSTSRFNNYGSRIASDTRENVGVPQGLRVTDSNFSVMLHEYPWFHGMLSRTDASALVLQSGREGHGLFLVRQSETRMGEYVLTFNSHGRAKHLRLTIGIDGRARVQNMCFNTVFDMLELFRTHDVPLDTNNNNNNAPISGLTGANTLNDYIIAWPPQRIPRRSRRGPVDPRDFMCHGGSVRVRTRSLERLAIQLTRSQATFWAPERSENSYQIV